MNYSEILKEAISKSNLSLNEISLELNKLGFKANKSYLSKLQNGNVPPSGDRFNKALGTVLGVDPVKLQAAAYREKVPAEVLEELISNCG